jgi:hypothetical protein
MTKFVPVFPPVGARIAKTNLNWYIAVTLPGKVVIQSIVKVLQRPHRRLYAVQSGMQPTSVYRVCLGEQRALNVLTKRLMNCWEKTSIAQLTKIQCVPASKDVGAHLAKTYLKNYLAVLSRMIAIHSIVIHAIQH